jgi:hypothetical protein
MEESLLDFTASKPQHLPQETQFSMTCILRQSICTVQFPGHSACRLTCSPKTSSYRLLSPAALDSVSRLPVVHRLEGSPSLLFDMLSVSPVLLLPIKVPGRQQSSKLGKGQAPVLRGTSRPPSCGVDTHSNPLTPVRTSFCRCHLLSSCLRRSRLGLLARKESSAIDLAGNVSICNSMQFKSIGVCLLCGESRSCKRSHTASETVTRRHFNNFRVVVCS